jgi:hypothetical protein
MDNALFLNRGQSYRGFKLPTNPQLHSPLVLMAFTFAFFAVTVLYRTLNERNSTLV